MKIYHIILPEDVVTEQKITLSGLAPTIDRIKQPNTVSNNMIIDTFDYRQKYGFDLSNSEICNFQSHQIAWQHFLESDTEWCLVLESNVCINTSTDEIIDCIRELPDDWDLFFPYDIQMNKMKINGESLININRWEFGKYEPYLLRHKLGNSIYLLSRKGAEKLTRINIINDRLDHTILKMEESSIQLELYYSEVSWLEPSEAFIKNYEWPERTQSILNAALEQTSWTDQALDKARDLLKVISDIGINKNINLMLEAGTLLAYVRHGEMMMWDDDIDIGINKKDLPILFAELDKQGKYKHAGGFFFRGSPFYRIWDIEGDPIENASERGITEDGYSYTFPFVDIWPYEEVNGDLVFDNGIIYHNTIKVGFEKILFEGATFTIPKNALEALDSRFVDWRDTIRVYSWSHKQEQHGFKYLCIPIETDESGRIIN